MLAEKVIAIIADTKHISADTLSVDSTFEALEIDSLDAVEIVYRLEEEFKISIPDEAVKGVRSVQDVVTSLEAILAGGTPDAAAAAPG
jgi:acyl carrier protein